MVGGSSEVAERARAAVVQLQERLLERHAVLAVDRVNEPRVAAAVEWLKENQHPDGHWGLASPTATSLCALALALWRQPGDDDGLPRTCEWLLSSTRDGRLETWWDTAVALRAIERAGHGSSPAASCVKERLRELESDPEQIKPHHGAQILNLFTELHESRSQAKWIAFCESGLERENEPYVDAQLAQALMNTGRWSTSIERTLERLSDYCQTGAPSASSFLAYVASFQALAAASDYRSTVEIALDRLFTDAYRTDGSWYHEPWYTA